MAQKTACVTLDVEADFHNLEGTIRLFDDQDLFEQYVALIQKYDAKVTSFLVTSILKNYGKNLKNLAKRIPLEYEIHSHRHDLNEPCSKKDILAAVEDYKKFTGKSPLGYRAPVGQITPEGWDTLFNYGFKYDASIYPSYRPGKLGYNHLKLPVSPFRVMKGKKSLIEFPFGSMSGIRLVFSLSYVKLLGWQTYKTLLQFFPLPDQILILSHPYDFYFDRISSGIKAWEKPLLSRNADKAFEIFDKMLGYLQSCGYQFCFASEMAKELENSLLPTFTLGDL